ncbi:MAG: GGDEF domain-containing protein [Lachnospiraceae bacterium]|nr:GGDEF domain-containing protein [Lachnospiraceae bacterium]
MDINRYSIDIQKLIQQIEYERYNDSLKAIEDCDKLKKIGNDINDNSLVGYSCYTKGELNYLNNDIPNFYREMLNCLQPLEQEHEWSTLVMANNMLGIMALNRGNAPFAMDYYIRALDLCRRYRLIDLEWIVHMNIGTLYLNVDDKKNALAHLKEGYSYIHEHRNEWDSVINLTAAYVNIGKAYLVLNDIDQAEEYWKRLEGECLSHIEEKDKVSAYCFGARLYKTLGDKTSMLECITNLNAIFQNNTIAIMDVFDDVYEYLTMLIEIKDKENFAIIWVNSYELTKKTTIIDMERRLIELQLNYYIVFEENEAYASAVLEYAMISMAEAKERSLMVSNMIALRTSLQDLTTINHKVERENEILQRKSETDPLTGLYNRFGLNDYWEKAFEKAYHNKSEIAMEILDIDYFKEYNDNYGHQAGDRCLIMISDCIKALQRRGGIFCARYGGDEFVIIFEGYNEKEVTEIVEELTERIEQAHLEHKFSKAADVVTISQGVCCGIPNGTEKAFDYMHSADVMLYQVKESGKNGMKIGGCMEWGK